ncbi:Glycosyltransferase [Synechococcus sp. WH 8101]|uniref:TIGR04282 family arsenosugar biosynthesis glycosyltransferase n=1 Tax=Synechococcus sp. WH 8101 TaxID=59932 RepID=UPI00102318EE|nr:TIGR04282 family arsenosugar biosynthesis glycosyltransferase [Synechococcus sp. WH 8101]QBE69549.1 Glycosyltransferase [Synechococcus sp. WH 8101]QNI45800.1 hypothetical protein SynRCC2555_02020 [Synechococcus sp. WH 8101]
MNGNDCSAAHRPVVVIMGRWPAEGRCKRRLSQGVGAQRAAAIQRRLSHHSLAVARTLAQAGHVHLRVALSGCGSKAARRWLGRSAGTPTLQGAGGLGERMRRQLLQTQRRHRGSAILLIGSDLPGLEGRDLMAALDALQHHPLVLGPAADGGYWLLGLQANLLNPVVSWPFSAMPWGSERVLAITRQRARAQGLDPWLLQTRNDLDRIDDLSPWLASGVHG